MDPNLLVERFLSGEIVAESRGRFDEPLALSQKCVLIKFCGIDLLGLFISMIDSRLLLLSRSVA